MLQFYAEPSNEALLTSLYKHGISPASPELNLEKDPFFDGKAFVLTGSLQHGTRKEMETRIKSKGGRTASSVSKKTDYLVAGENAGSKLDKAKSLDVAILTEAELVERLGI